MNERIAWQLANPAGVIRSGALKANSHPETLEGKSVLLYWNGKHGGDSFLNRLAELLSEKVKGISIVKSWETAPETTTISFNPNVSKRFAAKLAEFKPDIVIGSQGD